jgi:hypothetical protein
MAKGAEVYDANKGEWVAASDEQAAHHHAVIAGSKLPSDRTEADMRKLEPGRAGPVLTANENTVDMDRAGAGAGRATGTGSRGANP